MMNEHDKWASGTALPLIQTATNAATAYIESGWAVVPIPPGEKGPRFRNWQNRRFGPSEFKSDDNIGVVLGTASGDLVDVDLDCPEAVALAPDFLPPTFAVFGRSGKPNSHYFYR